MHIQVLNSGMVTKLSSDSDIESRIVVEVERRRSELIELARELIRTPSLSGQEDELATLISSHLADLGFENVRMDEVGNVLGSIGGVADEGCLLLNGHMDHVPPADMPDPYLAEIKDGTEFGASGDVIVGRGASDMKGALASMMVAGSVLKDLDFDLERRLIVAAVVLEEADGIGSRFLVENGLAPGGVVIGESTNLEVALGHRGFMEITITTEGQSCHASAPERGVNALHKMIPIMQDITSASEEIPSHPILGKSSMTATKISVSPNVINVVPNLCTVSLDVRNTPDFESEQVLQMLRNIAEQARNQDPDTNVSIELARKSVRSYTGYVRDVHVVTSAFYTAPETPLAQMAKKITDRTLQKESKFRLWVFATDGCHFANRGIPTVGFGPGEERFAHSRMDNVAIEHIVDSTKVYAGLAAEFCRPPEKS